MHECEAANLGIRLVYKLIDLDRLGLPETALGDLILAAERLGFIGLNITHPCKQAAVRFVDSLSQDAEAIGAINTILFKDGRRVGHNTDCSGFIESFRRSLADAPHDRVLLLGAGGAGAAVGHALLKLGTLSLSVFDIDRRKAAALAAKLNAFHGQDRAHIAEDLKVAVRQVDGLVNTTPVGMTKYPGTPIAHELLRPDLWVADIIYFPVKTALLQTANRLGCRTMTGEGMAIFQAVHAFRLFTGLEPDPERMRHCFESTNSEFGE